MSKLIEGVPRAMGGSLVADSNSIVDGQGPRTRRSPPLGGKSKTEFIQGFCYRMLPGLPSPPYRPAKRVAEGCRLLEIRSQAPIGGRVHRNERDTIHGPIGRCLVNRGITPRRFSL